VREPFTQETAPRYENGWVGGGGEYAKRVQTNKEMVLCAQSGRSAQVYLINFRLLPEELKASESTKGN